MKARWVAWLPLALAIAASCARQAPPSHPAVAAKAAAPVPVVASPAAAVAPRPLDRATFNATAAELDLPIFWRADTNADGSVQPGELAVLWRADGALAEDWLGATGFGPRFEPALHAIEEVARHGHRMEGLPPAERRRREAVLQELRQGRPTLVERDLRETPAEDKVIVRHVLAAAAGVERLFARQNGVFGLDAQIPRDDALSRALFHRNQSPWCEAPTTEKDPFCNALPERPSRSSGLYPVDLQLPPGFCGDLQAGANEKALMAPFVAVVRGEDGVLNAVPYQKLWKQDMEAVAAELQAAAVAVTNTKESGFKGYLAAAAQAFRDGNWTKADEAWAAMGATNSAWYLRIAPDETYFEPCSRKAGFHVSFARISDGSKRWHDLLEPRKAELERAMADLAGPPYVARKVAFHLPDFIEILLNAGDSRSGLGATVGQSLPNYGAVASEGRGRTVAMVNLYTDADSKAALRGQIESLFCAQAMPLVTTEPEPQLMSTVLHEAAHNLGPSSDYAVAGKTDEEIFGGALAATLEELKAQTAALYFTQWLATRQLIGAKEAQVANVADITWDLGHVAQGLRTPDGKPKPYSHLASIQVGALFEAGALSWHAQEKAANTKDVGCFEVHTEKIPGAIEALMRRVAGIKARGDLAGAQALVAEYVEREDTWQQLRDVIRARWLRAPKANFVYAVRL